MTVHQHNSKSITKDWMWHQSVVLYTLRTPGHTVRISIGEVERKHPIGIFSFRRTILRLIHDVYEKIPTINKLRLGQRSSTIFKFCAEFSRRFKLHKIFRKIRKIVVRPAGQSCDCILSNL